jgi:hypothetical protein
MWLYYETVFKNVTIYLKFKKGIPMNFLMDVSQDTFIGLHLRWKLQTSINL